jgi:hypothetical protein
MTHIVSLVKLSNLPTFAFFFLNTCIPSFDHTKLSYFTANEIRWDHSKRFSFDFGKATYFTEKKM